MSSREEFLAIRRKYWEKHGDRLNAERRRRRAENPEYRERIRAQERASREAKKNAERKDAGVDNKGANTINS